MTRTLLVVLCEKAAKRAFIAVVMCSLGWSQSDAENETERTLRAVQPQVSVVRECYMTTAALYAGNTCEEANTVVEAVLAMCSQGGRTSTGLCDVTSFAWGAHQNKSR